MEKSIVGKLLNLLVCGLILAQTEALSVGMTLVKNAVEKGAVCLDGSPPAYHFDKGSGTGINSWVVHFEGGGWCNNVSTCISRMSTALGSSKYMRPEIDFIGIMENRQDYNPDFYSWNRVYIRYCDGSSYTSDTEEVDPATNLHFRGARIFGAVMEELLSLGMNNADNALLSGCSAGGLASIFHCDGFKALLPARTKVKCLTDGGYFINVKDITGVPRIEDLYSQVVALHGSAKNLPSYCTSQMKPELCFFPQHVVPGVQTPLFILNSAYDAWQVNVILVPMQADPTNAWKSCRFDFSMCSPAQIQTLQDFRKQFLESLPSAKSPSRGLYIDSCYAHCQTEMQELWFMPQSPELDKTKIAKAVGDWFYDRSPVEKIDCPYPCNPSCPVHATPPREHDHEL